MWETFWNHVRRNTTRLANLKYNEKENRAVLIRNMEIVGRMIIHETLIKLLTSIYYTKTKKQGPRS